MSNQQQPQRYKNAEDYNTKRGDERKNRDEWRRSRSRSGSRNHMRRSHHHRRDDSRSRSRSRSLERRRRRRHSSYSRSRSRSRGYGGNRHDRRKNSRRYRDSRSPSRTRHSRSGSRSRNGPQAGHNRQNASNQNTQYYDKYQQSNAPRDGGMHEDSNESSNSLLMPDGSSGTNVENLQLPKRESVGAYYDLNTDEPIDKERIHREIEEKLREALAKEGKVYPPPKPEASHPVFANDGSFLEIFKKMQEQQKQTLQTSSKSIMASVPSAATAGGPSTSTAAAYVAASAAGKAAPPPPMVGRRRGGKILKTGLVAKQKAQSDTSADPKDFWSLYLAEVNKYKSHACESDGGTRPLVK